MPSTEKSQIPQYHVVGFTGHRRLEDPEGVAKLIRSELENLISTHKGIWTALSSVAEGADMLFARESLALKLPWWVLLPLPPAVFRADFDDTEWNKVEVLLAEATRVSVVAHSGKREDAYLDCGHETVNDCDVLIAVWDGEAARGKGGTEEIITYARKLNKPVIIIDPDRLKVRREGLASFVELEPNLARFNALPDPEGPVDHNPFNAPESVLRFQDKTDRAAIKMSPRLRTLATVFLLLHVFASFIGTALVAFSVTFVPLTWIEPAFVTLAFLTALVFRQKRRHSEWVGWRLAAETCRSAVAMWELPRASHFLRDLDIPGMDQLIRSLHIMHQQVANVRTESLPLCRDNYIKFRLDDQIAYFRRQIARAEPKFRWFRYMFWGATALAIVLTTANAVHATLGLAPVGAFKQSLGFVFLPIVLPALAAATISIVSINDWQRRVARYREMVDMLNSSRARVEEAHTWRSLENEIHKIEGLLFQEVLEWHTITSYSDAR